MPVRQACKSFVFFIGITLGLKLFHCKNLLGLHRTRAVLLWSALKVITIHFIIIEDVGKKREYILWFFIVQNRMKISKGKALYDRRKM